MIFLNLLQVFDIYLLLLNLAWTFWQMGYKNTLNILRICIILRAYL